MDKEEKKEKRKNAIKIGCAEYILTDNPKVLFNDDNCFYSIKQKTTEGTVHLQMSKSEFWHRMTMTLPEFKTTGTTVLKQETKLTEEQQKILDTLKEHYEAKGEGGIGNKYLVNRDEDNQILADKLNKITGKVCIDYKDARELFQIYIFEQIKPIFKQLAVEQMIREGLNPDDQKDIDKYLKMK